ncbi:MAG: FtsX-like permease family protein [Bacteroidales bacterium]
MKLSLTLKSFLKFLFRNKLYTLIDIAGLAISLTFVVIIGIFVTQEFNTDQFHENKTRIYALSNGELTETAFGIGGRLKEIYPEIEEVCPVITRNFIHHRVISGTTKLNADLIFADPSFFSVFSFPLVSGDPKNVLTAENHVVLSESFARKMFGNDDPIGKSLQLTDSLTLIVNGIYKDIRNSTIPAGDMVIHIKSVFHLNPSIMENDGLANAGSTNQFFLIREGIDFRNRESDLLNWLKSNFWIYQREIYHNVKLIPLTDLYFSGMKGYALNYGNKSFVYILFGVGLIILLFAIINYINLTIAQNGIRAREMATKRLLGTTAAGLFNTMILETTLLSFVSLLIALGLTILLTPFAENVLETTLDLSLLLSPGAILLLALLVIITGALAGFLPALTIYGIKPINIIKGSYQRENKMVFSKLFILFQNAISIALLSATLVINAQVNHLITAPLGYTKDPVLETYNLFESKTKLNTFINELRKQPFVDQIGMTQGAPNSGSNNITMIVEGKNVSFQQIICDEEYFNLMGFAKLRQNGDAATGWYLSKEAIRQIEKEEDAAFFEAEGKITPISGIIADFHFENITNPFKPVMLRINKSENMEPWQLAIKINGDPWAAKKEIANIFTRITDEPFVGEYLSEQIEESYKQQQKTATILKIFTCIAFVISFLGLLAMSTYFIQQRSSEIAIRKVFGSSNREILIKLITEFIKHVVIAFIIIIPFIWLMLHKWLESYSYKISLSPLFFITGGLVCLSISFLTVFLQSYRAANANPVNRLKDKN